jgi:hypothetical protein
VSQFFLTSGLRVGTFAYNFAANAILKGTFAFNGAASPSDHDEARQHRQLHRARHHRHAGHELDRQRRLREGQRQSLTTAIQSIDLNGTNNLRDQNAVSYKFPAGIGAGRMELSGSLKAYFADGSLWDKFIEHDTMSLEFNVSDVDRHHYEFTIPTCDLLQRRRVSPGGNQDVMEDLQWMAKRDAATNCQIQIDRFSCTYPPTA